MREFLFGEEDFLVLSPLEASAEKVELALLSFCWDK